MMHSLVGVTGRRSYMTNCILKPREFGEGAMFSAIDGEIYATLDRYAIIPVEDYEALVAWYDNSYTTLKVGEVKTEKLLLEI